MSKVDDDPFPDVTARLRALDANLEQERSRVLSDAAERIVSAPRRNPVDEILPGRLFLGSIGGRHPDHLTAHGITHVLAIQMAASERPTNRPLPPGIVEQHVSFDDHPGVDLLVRLPACLAFLETALRENPRHAVLVHCTAGISRSASVVIAYLMRRFAVPFETAYAYVATKRPIVCPNWGFQEQLRTWDGTLD